MYSHHLQIMYQSTSVQTPSVAKVKEISKRIGFDLSNDEVLEYNDLFSDAIQCFNVVETIPEPTLPVKYPRLPGYRPSSKENELNAWYWKTNIAGASDGILKGKSVAIKDNIAVYGVPMMGGSWTMEGYVPEFDATVVTRILDAGGIIKGKSTCDDLCRAGTGITAARGPVLNPHSKHHIAGGSSGGSAVLVATGEVDMAIGSDQGGSIRLPASCCGIVGLKPTYGLVPYTGAQCAEPTLDHLGPMANNVYNCALLLEVIAGYDHGLDSRQPTNVSAQKYTESLKLSTLAGFKIGVLKEGFEHKHSDVRVNKLIRQTVAKLKTVEAEIKQVSVPMHKYGVEIGTCIIYTGELDTLIKGGGNGSGRKGFYSTSMSDSVTKGLATQPNNLQPPLKFAWMLGEYMKEEYRGRYYGKGQNLARLLKAKFDDLFKSVDVIVMPTIPFLPRKIPPKESSVSDIVRVGSGMGSNTRSFSITGLPALSLNAGFIDGLPVGMMIVGNMFEECKLFQVAYAIEKLLIDDNYA